MRYPLACPDVTDREIEAVVAVLRTPQLSMGPKVGAFEASVARRCGARHAIAVSSGTAALHLLVRGMDIAEGNEVITTPFSFVASTNCMLYERAKPVFVDIDPDTWNIDVRRIEAAVTSRTKAILPVDAFGQPADYDTISAIARRHRLRVIEDSCEALGALYKGRPAGSLGDAGAFGFYPNKQITTGEGGMIVTDDEKLAATCRSLRNQGRDVDGGWLAHPRLGYNYRLSDIHCALGAAQMERLDELLATRRRVAQWYHEILAGDRRIIPPKVASHVEVSWFVFVVRLSDDYDSRDRDRILSRLAERGIGCSNYFAPIHLQAYVAEKLGCKRGDFPICEAVADRTIALPFQKHLTQDDVAVICAELRGML